MSWRIFSQHQWLCPLHGQLFSEVTEFYHCSLQKVSPSLISLWICFGHIFSDFTKLCVSILTCKFPLNNYFDFLRQLVDVNFFKVTQTLLYSLVVLFPWFYCSLKSYVDVFAFEKQSFPRAYWLALGEKSIHQSTWPGILIPSDLF